ncbi:MAG: bifunctional riboflavin kinase/FAD synthetase [Oscillospiraceae bacterium]|nr:bifunctional riboflavin kinase/FAD synthetase [Oscillospiraceae bacterium]
MKKTIYALGFFDGVHLGHRALLETCRELARQRECFAGVITFSTHPGVQLRGESPGLISGVRDREKLILERYRMDSLVTLPFDEHMRTLPWEAFIQMLLSEYDAAGFVCGEDFRFGFRGQGTAPLLSDYCGQRKLPCMVVPEQTIDGIRVSSTYIRRQIETGDMETAVRFLGHPHQLTGMVVHGQGLGRKLGMPTANLKLPEGLAVPKFGVYVCRAIIDGQPYPAVTNIGTRPTVEGSGITVEPWILDYSGDLYGREITLEFYRFLRPEMKFPDLDALQAEIRNNAEQARLYLKTTFTQ